VLVAIADIECGGELGDWAREIRRGINPVRVNVDPDHPMQIVAVPISEAAPGDEIEGGSSTHTSAGV
jgi:hypothetical protein